MTAPATVWLVVGLVATVVLAILLVGLIRQGVLVGRTAMRLARDVADATEGMGSVGRGGTGRR